jgi:RNA polymerase sigma-70 factor (ECF subfamily)
MSAATAPDVRDDAPILDYEELFREHAPMVYRTARAVTGSPEEAEDVVQTIFLRLIRAGHSSNSAANLKAYLHRAAVNLSLDVLRSRRRHAFTHDLESLEAPPPASAGFGGPASPALDVALARLQPEAVQLLTLRYVHGYNDADIAGLLGTSRGAIAVRLFRLRRRLKKLLRAPRGEKR